MRRLAGNGDTTHLQSLGSFDNAQALTAERTPYNLVTVLTLEQSVDAEQLREVLARLTRRHSMLRARVVDRGGRRFELLDDAPAIPLDLEPRRNDRTWIGIVEAELARRVHLHAVPLGRCVLVTSNQSQKSEIVLSLPHVLVDGTAMTHVAVEIVSGLVGSETASEQGEASLPRGAEERFPTSWQRPRRWPRSALFLLRQLVDEIAFRWRTRGQLQRPPAGEPRCHILPFELGEKETELLVRAARQARVTVTAALEAAMLLAVVRHRYSGPKRPHRYFTFPLLRRYLEPPVSDEVVRCYATLLRLSVDVSDSDNLWRLAATIHRDIDRAMRRGERFLASLWSHFSMRMIFAQRRARMATTALSYTGALSRPNLVDNPRISAIRAFVSNFPLGPEYTAQARLFRGRIWFDVVYLANDMDAAQAAEIAETMRELLTGASHDKPVGPA
jgi:hypothetical protein